jgi:hypothetical protein
MLLEKRAVTPPSRRGTLRERGADRRKDLTGFARNLIDQVEREEPDNPQNAMPDQALLPATCNVPSGHSAKMSNAIIDRNHHVP